MDGSPKLVGWEIYPQNLNYVRSCDVHGYNFASYCQQLSAESKRHFVRGSDRIAVKVVEFGAQGKPYRTSLCLPLLVLR
jgi:elongation factor P hydroxylase